MSNPQQPGQPGPQGQPPHGQGPGTPPGGQPQYGQAPGTPPGGQPQYGPGTPPGGQPQYGQAPGTPPGGQPQYGQAPGGQPQYGPGTPPGGQPQYGQVPGTPPQGVPGQQPPPPFGQQPVQVDAMPPGPPPTPPKKSKGRLIGLAIVAVVVVVIGILAVVNLTKSPASADAGDCIKVNNASTTDADVEKIDCGSAEAVLQVAKKLDSASAKCPEGNYQQYTSEGRGSDFSLCLMLNAKKGECFNDLDSVAKARKVDCAGAQTEVLDVVEGKSDQEACAGAPNTNNGRLYTEPARVICLEDKQ
ncbi:hypothetical protein L6E12_13155 [Actinokineospora sp. PR83]|uniref:LppU/SCO3897 family protein n=1 Tax=Actinokineospora sp. PR83 TaxID=2884908 RepID=UPI001F272ADE|nr:hypothetical protein [Actinokineospora sp. PR83]MCG8916740.1 hypothetical protein [Actinokineospora sp. PR83]